MLKKIDNEAVTQVKKTKFLGVIINCNLIWKEHISYISGKIDKRVGILIKARKYLNKTTLMNLYYTFFILILYIATMGEDKKKLFV